MQLFRCFLQLTVVILLAFGLSGGFDKVEWVRNAATDSEENSGSYLDWPRFHFAGTFMADSPTGNNLVENYDIETFDERLRQRPDILGYNPEGSGSFQLLECKVTRVCYRRGECITNSIEDSLIGRNILSSVKRSQAKMVDLDPEHMLASTIFGMTVHLPGAFSANLLEAAMTNAFRKMPHAEFDSALGVEFFSLLTDVDWHNDPQHPQILEELKEYSGNQNVLFIKFNLDSYNSDVTSTSFRTGRIVGTIGIAGSALPLHGLRHRQLGQLDTEDFGMANFRVFPDRGKILIDLGNALMYNLSGSPDLDLNQILEVAFPSAQVTQSLSCETQVEVLDQINYTSQNWYEKTGGVISIPEESDLTQQQLSDISHRPLMIRQLDRNTNSCLRVVLAERVDGVAVGVLGERIFRQGPGDIWRVHAFSTAFGRPLRNVSLEIKTVENNPGESPRFTDGDDIQFNHHISAVQHSQHQITDNNGVTWFDFTGQSPGNPRKIIDGQLYLFDIQVHVKEPFTSNQPIAILMYDDFLVSDGGPTWYQDIYPIFKMYANMFPSMNKVINMASYEDVLRKKEMMKLTLSLPDTDPAFMPFTRDLSKQKQQAILRWLDDPKLGDIPILSLQELKDHLQTALEIELATIPPYLTAWFSIKRGHNVQISNILRSIAMEEMLHMTLVANILRSICGHPVLDDVKVIPKYPSKLPGGVHPGLTVSLHRLSKGLIEDVFMKIEEPDDTLPIQLRQSILYSTEHESSSEPHLKHHYNTIGEFYYKKIWRSLLFHANKDNDLFRCGSKSTQITEDDWYSHAVKRPFPVLSIEDARRAILVITEEGEGSSPTQPFDYDGNLSHYFKFLEVVMGNRLVLDKDSAQKTYYEARTSIDACVIDYSDRYTSRVCGANYKPCNRMYVHERCKVPYHFTGERLPFHVDGIWPIIDDPQRHSYPKESKVRLLSYRFNTEYSNLLRCIHRAFNENPREMKTCMSMMAKIELLGRQLVKTPIRPGGDPNIGPNGTPTFEFLSIPHVDPGEMSQRIGRKKSEL